MVLIKKNKRDLSEISEKTRQSFVRINGWTYPLHPLQLLAWTFIVIFGIVYFVFMVPTLPSTIVRGFAWGINLFVYISHFVIHVTAVNTNPADDNVIDRIASRKSKPANFDRTKHVHVIENQFCYICEANVGIKSKHCSVCNKCVSDFDHHCKWLNNCVGGKNYRLFICCVISALLGCLIVFTVSVILIIAFFSSKSWFYDNTSTLLFFNNLKNNMTSVNENYHYQSVHIIWISVVIFTSILSLIAAALLAHLLGFHLFLNCIGLSTYEFVVRQRTNESNITSFIPSDRNRLIAFLETTMFVCRTKKRIQPVPSPHLTQTLQSKSLTKSKNSLSSPKINRSKTQQNIKSELKTSDKSIDHLKDDDTINNDLINNAINNESYKRTSEISIGKKIMTETEEENVKNSPLTQSQDLQPLQRSDTQLNKSTIENDVNDDGEDQYNDIMIKEPIFKPLNAVPQNGRMSRLSYASRNAYGSRASPDSGISSHTLFIRRQSLELSNGGNLRVISLPPEYGSKTSIKSDLSIAPIDNTANAFYHSQFNKTRHSPPR